MTCATAVGITALRVLMPSLIAGENGIATLGAVATQEIPSYDYDLRAWCAARASVHAPPPHPQNPCLHVKQCLASYQYAR